MGDDELRQQLKAALMPCLAAMYELGSLVADCDADVVLDDIWPVIAGMAHDLRMLQEAV